MYYKQNLIKMNEFICPHCNGLLSVNNNVVFSAENSKSDKGLIFLSPILGEYSVTINQNFKFRDGELIKIYCPMCNKNLTGKGLYKNLARIKMRDEEGKINYIIFSGIAGENCTYKISESGDIEKFGSHSSKYVFDYENMINFM